MYHLLSFIFHPFSVFPLFLLISQKLHFWLSFLQTFSFPFFTPSPLSLLVSSYLSSFPYISAFPSVLFTVSPSLSFPCIPPFCKQPKQSLLHIRLWSMNGEFYKLPSQYGYWFRSGFKVGQPVWGGGLPPS